MSNKLSEIDKKEFVMGVKTCIIMGIVCGILLTCVFGSVGIFNFDKTSPFLSHTKEENVPSNKMDNTYKHDELNYNPKAQKPNEILNEQEENKPTENTLSNSSEITVDFKPYMRELQRRIKMNWSPPISGRDKTVEILFKISKDGRLLSYEIQKSSGITEVDIAAVQAIQLTAPFRPLPEGFKGDSIDILFTFDYHKIQ